MRIIIKTQRGLSLVELLLVIAIGAVFTMLAVKQYQTFHTDTDTMELKFNVDTIFQSMALFYQANCYGNINPASATHAVLPGRLNPTAAPAPTNPYPINIAVDLTGQNFLTINLPINPLVDSTGPGTNGYVAQFNEYTSNAMVCTTTNGTAVNGANDPNCTGTAKSATIVQWKPQVAILLKDTAQAQQYLNMLTGDCLSTYNAGTGTVNPCSANTPGNYVVWEREPSYSSAPSASGFELMMPGVDQFKNMYTTYPTMYLINPQINATIQGAGGIGTEPQYLYCGS